MALHSYEKMMEDQIISSESKFIFDWDFHGGKSRKNEWIVTEKVHGANLSFSISLTESDSDIVVSKRRGVIDENDSFFGFRSLLPEINPCIRRLARLISKESEFSSFSQLTVFGELFGGCHDSLPVVVSKNGVIIESVQREIHYDSSLHFYAFDIGISTGTSSAEKLKFLNADDQLRLFQEASFPCFSKPLFRGSLSQCFDFPLKFKSTLASSPSSNEKFSWAEGVVLRPVLSARYRCNSERCSQCPHRVICKRKAQRFKETVIHSSVRAKRNGNLFHPLVNAARVTSAVSKIGPLSKDTFDEIASEIMNDVLDEMGQRGDEEEVCLLRKAIVQEMSWH